jgi:hypothetical protein
MSRVAEDARDLLRNIRQMIDEAPDSPRRRALHSKWVTFDRVMGGWAFRPPTEAQAAAMLECVSDLYALACTVARRPRPSTMPPPGVSPPWQK